MTDAERLRRLRAALAEIRALAQAQYSDGAKSTRIQKIEEIAARALFAVAE